jgi:hypothetical protein
MHEKVFMRNIGVDIKYLAEEMESEIVADFDLSHHIVQFVHLLMSPPNHV